MGKLKERNLNKTRYNIRGITLIALVITIVVLIILAGVSINLVMGENGIIEKTKEAKENTEKAQKDEKEKLDEILEYIDTLGQGREIIDIKEKGYVDVKTIVKDTSGNKFVLPKGFKIAEDSGNNVTEGIVIEDNDIIEGIGNNRGNQYVWIPVGKEIKKSDGTTVDIELGRYVFADGTNNTDEDGNKLLKGTPILKQSGENYQNETPINIKEINPTSTEDYEYKELKINRLGVLEDGLNGLNATAFNLKGFIDSVKANGGYYIARYEASYGVDGKANSKVSNTFTRETTAPTTRTEGMLWNYITQIDSAIASRNLYETINSDLINSYAWDTALVYIQAFSEDTDYSRQDGCSINYMLTNTGANGDEVCKINDMASNTNELTTEYCTYNDGYTAYPFPRRGGFFAQGSFVTSGRYYVGIKYSDRSSAFRTTLYI